VHGELKSLQVVNIAEGEKRFRKRPLEISISKTKGVKQMAYVMQEYICKGGVDNHGELRSRKVVFWSVVVV